MVDILITQRGGRDHHARVNDLQVQMQPFERLAHPPPKRLLAFAHP